jgi:predicted permease
MNGAANRARDYRQDDRTSLAIGAAAFAIGMEPTIALVAMIFGAVPTAEASFSLAREMGSGAHHGWHRDN